MTYSIPNIPLSYSCYEEATRGFGGEIGLRDQKETPHKYLVC